MTRRVVAQIIAAVAVVGALAEAVWLVRTLGELGKYRDLSAVQVTQLYTQATFWMLFVVVILLAAILYVVSDRD